MSELATFYKNKKKQPNLYGYDDDGNLIELNKEGTVVKTIPLPEYRSPTMEEFDEMSAKRDEEIAKANREYEDARRALRQAKSLPDTPDSELLRLNRLVIEKDIVLQNIRFPLYNIHKQKGTEINKIDFNQPNEKRKFPYSISIYQTRPYTLQDQYVRIGKLSEKPLVSVAEAKAAANAGPKVILFAEPDTNDYGFLSLKWVVQIEFNSTMYNSAYQAIMAEIAKSFNDTENLEKIMAVESPEEITYKVEDVPGDAEVNETKWNDLTKRLLYDVNLAKFNQYPELTSRLLETKNATLGAYIPDDNLIGIGISLDNIQSQNAINWTGQNLLGKALMDIRQKIRTDREVAASMAVAAAPVPVVRKKRPGIAPSASIAAPPVVSSVAPANMAVSSIAAPPVASSVAPSSMAVPEAAIGIPRPIRRKPVPSTAPVAAASTSVPTTSE
jgi:ribA/ribD-fused uncharacterized protein